MSHFSILVALLLLALTSVTASLAQPADPPKDHAIARNDAEGTHFIVGFMQNEENTSPCALMGDRMPASHRILISATEATMITMTMLDGGTQILTIPADTSITVTLDGEEYECLGEGICSKSIEIVADHPVLVYCFSSKLHTSDGYLALPISSWGTEYVAATAARDAYEPSSPGFIDSCESEPRGGVFAVIAVEDTTVVRVIATERTLSGVPAGTPQTKTLMKGEIWQLQDGEREIEGSDLTGSRITATKPVGLITGHVRAGIPRGSTTKNHLIEMVPPIAALGSRYIVTPYDANGTGGYIRIISADTARTSVTWQQQNGSPSLSWLDPFEWIEVEMRQVSSLIASKGKVMVMHYAPSNAVDPTAMIDPILITVTPLEQYSTSAQFATMPNGRNELGVPQFETHYLSLVYRISALPSMRIDGLPLANDPRIYRQGSVPALDSAYAWMILKVGGGGTYRITGDSAFTGYVYGVGEFDSYGWPFGSLVDTTTSEPVGTPAIEVDGHDFGNVEFGTTICADILIHNPGTAPLMIDGITFEGDYHFDSTARPAFPMRILPGDTLLLRICFTPSEYGSRPGTITVASNAANGGSVDAALSGVGVDGSTFVEEAEERGEGEMVAAEMRGRLIVVTMTTDTMIPRDVRLFDARGAELRCGEIRHIGDRRFAVALAYDLPLGIYFIEGRDGDDSPFVARVIAP